MRKSSKNWEPFCVLKYHYLMRGYFIFGNKNAVFMRFVAFCKRLINKRKRGKRNEEVEENNGGSAGSGNGDILCAVL